MGRPPAVEYKEMILDVLKESYPRDLTQADISKKVGMDKNTGAKYLSELVKEQRIVMTRQIGKYKLYTLRKNIFKA